MAAASLAQLLDLPPDLLARIGALLPFEERLQLSLVCRRWREVCAGPSELWRSVDATIRHGSPLAIIPELFQPSIGEYVSWFTKRSAGVEELRLEIPQPAGKFLALAEPFKPFPVPSGLLHGGTGPAPPLPLRKIAIACHAASRLSFGEGGVSYAGWLPSLQKVAFFDAFLELPGCWPQKNSPPLLTDLSLIGGTLRYGDDDPIWLPRALTALVLSGAHMDSMPFLLISPPKLRSLVIDNNYIDGGDESGMFFLPRLTQLQELNLSNNPLGRPPLEIASLPALRILYLHAIVRDGQAPPPPGAWEPLRACTALLFLSISANGLTELPPAVAGMTHLQALHCEENDLAALPACPCLSNLRELLLDWRTAMASPAALQAATRLTRLILSKYQPAVPPGGGAGVLAQQLAQQPGAADALLAALAALPALRWVDDVFEEGATHLVTAEQARVMWQLGRRCPRLQLGQPRSTNLGWTLSSLVAELPHNAGTALLAEPAG